VHFLHIAFLIAFTFFKDFALEKCVTMVKVKMVKMRFELGHFAHYNNKYQYLFFMVQFTTYLKSDFDQMTK